MGEFSTMHSTRLSCSSRLELDRDLTQGLSQAREGAQGSGLSRNSKEVREGGREVMACFSKLERLLLDRSREVRKGRELKEEEPGQRMDARWVWVTVSLVRLGGRWEVDRQASLPFEMVNSFTPSNPLNSSVVLRPLQER